MRTLPINGMTTYMELIENEELCPLRVQSLDFVLGSVVNVDCCTEQKHFEKFLH